MLYNERKAKALQAIARSGRALGVAELHSRSGCGRQSLHTAVNSWTAYGYLVKKIGVRDGRPCFCYQLSAKGRKWLQKRGLI